MTTAAPGYEIATGENHSAFLAWCRAQGITFPKLTPARFPHAGLGIASTAPIAGGPPPSASSSSRRQQGETIAFTPTSALLTRENLALFAPRLAGRVRALLGELGTHACFAAAIAGERGERGNGWAPWMSVWPRLEEFREGVPLLWRGEEQELLPPSAILILDAQKRKFERDFANVTRLGFEFSRDEYIYAWLIVNTRSLFYKPDTPEYKELTRENCMALCPFIDYFNHSDNGCKVDLTPRGYTVTPSPGAAPLPAHTQLFLTYGSHSNDFLLCEYGFLLPTPANRWDEVALDAHILPRLTGAQRALLAREGFLGQYVFDRATFCFRTLAAVRVLLMGAEAARPAAVERWRRFVAGEEEGEREREAVERWLCGVLRELRDRGREAWGRAEEVAGVGVARLVRERWEQVLGMVESVGAEVGLREEGEGEE